MRYCLQKKREIQGSNGPCKWDPADTFVWTGHQLSHTRAQRSFHRAITPGTEQSWASEGLSISSASLGFLGGPSALSKSSVTLALTEYCPRGTLANPPLSLLNSRLNLGEEREVNNSTVCFLPEGMYGEFRQG